MFQTDWTLRFSKDRGFSETCFVLCPVCWNMSIRVTVWEDGRREEECVVCERRERSMRSISDERNEQP